MCSERLKRLIYLAIEPNNFSYKNRDVLYQIAQKEETSNEKVDKLVDEALRKKRNVEVTTSDKTFHKNFFLKRLYINGERWWMREIVCDGTTIVARRSHRNFFFGPPVEKTLQIDDIQYFDIFNKLGIRQRAEFGTVENQWSMRLMSSLAVYIRDVCVNNLARFSWPDSHIIKSQITVRHKLTQPFLWVNNDYIIRSHNCFAGTEERSFVKISDVAFFCKRKGVMNMNIYFGYYDQIDMDGLTPQDVVHLEQHCRNHKAKIANVELHSFEPKTSLFSWLNPLNWFRKERIALTDEAIIYYKKSLLSTDCTYLPYEDVKVARFGWKPLANLFNRCHIVLFGKQNIITNFSYSKSECADIIKQELDARGLEQKKYKIRRSWPWFKCLGADIIVITDDGLCLSAHPYKGMGTYGCRRNYYIPYDKIYHYEKFWWWLLWRNHYVKAYLSNIRKDQSSVDVTFKFKRVVCWASLYKSLDSSSAEQDMDTYHKECKKDNRIY